MKLPKILFAILIAVLAVGVFDFTVDAVYRFTFGKSLYSSKAVYKVPNSEVEIALERRQIHLFLAEYERTLHVVENAKDVINKEVWVDTGGYSRMNLYQMSPNEILLVGHFEALAFNTSTLFLNDVEQDKVRSGGVYLGCFDSDRNGWRFITASERPERKTFFAEPI